MKLSFVIKTQHIALAAITAFALTACHQTSFDEQCAKEAHEFTEKQCPQPMGDGVVMDSMTYTTSLRCLNYYYTLSGNLDDAKLIKENEHMLREHLLNSIINSVELRRAKNEGIDFRYTYFSKSANKQLLSITIRKDEYRK